MVRTVAERGETSARPRHVVASPWSARPPAVASAGGENQSPIVVLNLFYSGLAIAREMAGFGVRVIGLSSQRDAYGNSTRSCEVRFSPDSRDGPDVLAQFLLRAGQELRGAVIFPTRDFDLLFLDRFRSALEPHYRLAIPPRRPLFQVLDKRAFACVAQKAGVPTPRVFVLRSEERIDRVANEIGFPCVVKPVRSHQWRQGDNWERVGSRKAFLVNSVEELRNEYRRVSVAHPETLVQEWIPGTTENVVALGAYVGDNAEPLAYFTARKIIQVPDGCGTGCIVRSEEIPELLQPSLRLWRALGYRGMAEVEYKYDARVGEYKLIEMNARHWDQHQLGQACGINLSWSAYCHLTGRRVAPSRPCVSRATWVAEDSVLLYALRSAWRRELRLKRLLEELSGRRIYGIFSWRDPWPFARYLFTGILPAIITQVRAQLAKRRR